jgi:hypothetical protein
VDDFLPCASWRACVLVSKLEGVGVGEATEGGDVDFSGLARTIYIRCIYSMSWQGNHQIYGHIRCIYKVLANPRISARLNREQSGQHVYRFTG